ncbi:DEAD/DEAH box helicase [Labedaea rhizosphaerae]|uniref:SNF2 family DNA or RNA helicase n=1 Tax=Labedaea rhizosphaerae TaxID=598644 RepID=A0A4R6SIL7_LABRH|nr:DEAD/DEAH box helicase [Labedaea rhizosphaerae]TDQ04126.1 SNF2 family DNA or RNA helicase [Labedaea rhizosphaerae]
MLVLHAVTDAEGALAFWAEDSALPSRASGRATKAARPHPFAVSSDTLGTLALGEPDTLTLRLPAHPSAPVPSPELVRDPLAEGQAPRGTVELRQWLVPALRIDPASAPGLLAEPPDEVRLGPSCRFLGELAELADDLVRRGRFLPGLVDGKARWRPVLSGVDAARYSALLAVQPPSLTAAGNDGVLGLLDSLVDSAVRLALPDKDFGIDGPIGAWLRALTGEPVVDADPEALRRLGGRLDQWRASAVSDSPVRTCFRLRAPDQNEPAEESWRLELLMQPSAEPSLLVPAAQVWRDGGVLHRWLDDPQEQLLADLGRASRIVPLLDAALREAHPSRLHFDLDGAYEFLGKAAALDQAGFGVLLPSSWRRPGELSLKLSTKGAPASGVVAKAEGALNRASLVSYDWRLALGDDELTEGELAELAAAKVPMVRMRGQWVQVDAKQLAAGLAFLRHYGSGQMPIGQALLQAGLESFDGAGAPPLPVSAVTGDGWVGDLLSGQPEQYLTPVDPPVEFEAELRPYQKRGLAWLAFLDNLGLGGCLADDMGLGKTVQLLALEALRRKHDDRDPTLIVCPMSLVGTWQREAQRFTPHLRVHVHHGGSRLGGSRLADAVAAADLVITTYHVLTRDVEELSALRWDRVVADEAQNIKNSASRQSHSVRGIPARQRIALTGTPVENRLAELWSILDFANPGSLGSLSSFRARFAVPVERYGDQDAAARLRKVTAPFVLRRLKTDPDVIGDLPEKIEIRQLCPLTAEQASLYRAVVDDMLGKIDGSEGIERKGLVLSTIMKLKQVCNHPAQFLRDGSRIAGRSGKLARAEELIEEALAEGDRVLCFTQFAEYGSMLVPHLSARFDTEVAFLHGGTPKKSRDAMVERFQSDDGPRIFLLSLKAGGTGLTLTAANQVIHLDRWWNPAVEDQASDRAYRIGQRRDVQVRKLVCLGTLEERIDAMIEEKKALAQLVVGSGEGWLTELSTSSLRELLTLSSEAIDA